MKDKPLTAEVGVSLPHQRLEDCRPDPLLELLSLEFLLELCRRDGVLAGPEGCSHLAHLKASLPVADETPLL